MRNEIGNLYKEVKMLILVLDHEKVSVACKFNNEGICVHNNHLKHVCEECQCPLRSVQIEANHDDKR